MDAYKLNRLTAACLEENLRGVSVRGTAVRWKSVMLLLLALLLALAGIVVLDEADRADRAG